MSACGRLSLVLLLLWCLLGSAASSETSVSQADRELTLHGRGSWGQLVAATVNQQLAETREGVPWTIRVNLPKLLDTLYYGRDISGGVLEITLGDDETHRGVRLVVDVMDVSKPLEVALRLRTHSSRDIIWTLSLDETL